MRPLLGRARTVLARRWADIRRLAAVTLFRDQFAEGGPSAALDLAWGERTEYRKAAWLVDQFDRADGALGTGWAPWDLSGFDGLAIVDEQVEPAAVGVTTERFEVHTEHLPRDQWAELTIRALEADDSGGYASVGLVLRSTAADGDGNAYLVVAAIDQGDGLTRLGRIDAGVVSWREEIATPWAVGEVLRFEAQWATLRVYRQGVLILEHVDTTSPSALLTSGRAGVEAVRTLETDQAALDDFCAGPLRQETLGVVADMGDVQSVLGQPVAFDLSIVNLAPMGGADRFASLLRHGLNQGTDTYDVDRGEVRILTAVEGVSAPLPVAHGLIDSVGDMTESLVRIRCRGRDASLTPRLDPGRVVYIPGPDPELSSAPVPEDPCAPAPAPTVITGDPPDEPTDPETLDGLSPEAPFEEAEEEDGGLEPPLAGAWRVFFSYTLDIGGGPGGTDVYTGSTTVTQHDAAIGPIAGGTARDNWLLLRKLTKGDGTETFPAVIEEFFIYRGPDITGQNLIKNQTPSPNAAFAQYAVAMSPTEHSVTLRLAHYQAGSIKTSADLAALRPRNPSEATDPFPARIATLEEWTIASMPHASSPNVFGRTQDDAIPTSLTGGPQILRMELVTGWSSGVPSTDFTLVRTVTDIIAAPGAILPTSLQA